MDDYLSDDSMSVDDTSKDGISADNDTHHDGESSDNDTDDGGESADNDTHDNGEFADNDIHDDGESTDNDTPAVTVVKGRPYPERVNEVLESLYKSGMTGWGKKHASNLETAVKSTGLDLSQVQGWISRKNMKKRALEEEEEHDLPLKKKRTIWQKHRKNFAETPAGKVAMADNPGRFNREASETFQKLTVHQKQQLQQEIDNEFPNRRLTRKEALRRGETLFKRIQSLYDELETLGFKGFAVGFCGDFSQVMGTSTTLKLFTPQFLSYLNGMIAAADPPLPSQFASQLSLPPPPPPPSSKPLPLKSLSSSSSKLPPPNKSLSSKPPPTKSSSSKPLPTKSLSSKAPPTKSSSKPPSKSSSSKPPSPTKLSSKPPPTKPSSSKPPPTKPLSSKPPPTKPLTSNPPSTKPSSSKPPPTKPSSSNPPSTKPSSSKPLPTKPSSSNPPSSKPSSSKPPPTKPSSSKPPPTKPLQLSSSVIPSTSSNSEDTTTVNTDIIEIDGNEYTVPSTDRSGNASVMWIPELNLFEADRSILGCSDWINDNIIFASITLLSKHTTAKGITGWQSTQNGKNLSFRPIRPGSKFIQVFHIGSSHWVTASNVMCTESNTVRIYDSNRHSKKPSLDLMKQICSLLQPKSKSLIFDAMNVQSQKNGFDCGLFAIAYATELANGHDPIRCQWKASMLRSHLYKCFENRNITPFPLDKKKADYPYKRSQKISCGRNTLYLQNAK